MWLLGSLGVFTMLVALATLLERPRAASAVVLVVGAVMLGVALDACSVVIDSSGPTVRLGGG
jgi:hypothetical protein